MSGRPEREELPCLLSPSLRRVRPPTSLEVGLGDQEAVVGTTRLTRTVGYARSKDVIMMARIIEAAEAERIGLRDRPRS